MKDLLVSIVCAWSLCALQPAGAVDEGEALIANRLLSKYEHREAVWLEGKAGRFLALQRDPEGDERHGAVIIVHGMGQHADWPDVISPLRTRLPEAGWITFSLQMPVLAPERRLSDYADTLSDGTARIAAAVRYLHGRDFERVVVAGYGFGAAVAAAYLAGNAEPVRAFVGISMQAPPFLRPDVELLPLLQRIEIPVLDLYGSRDFDLVMHEVDDRRLAGRRTGNRHYAQLAVDGADHYFTGMESVLVEEIAAWLARVTDGRH